MAHQHQVSKWPTGLCDCMSDCGTCCCTFWCAPCQYGYNAEKLGDSCFLNCFLYLCFGGWCSCCFTGNRKKLRNNHRLAEEPCSDCCVMCWCPACAICQEARVLKTNGPAPQFVQAAQPMYYGAPPPHQAMK